MCAFALEKLITLAYVQVDLSDYVLLEFSEAQPSVDRIKVLLL